MIKVIALLTLAVVSIGGGWGPAALARGTPSTITCSRVIIPACGTIGGVRQNFRNACAARQAGATNVTTGNCTPRNVFCPMIYLPVCAVKNGREQSYSNSCVATNAGAKIVSKGQCGAAAAP